MVKKYSVVKTDNIFLSIKTMENTNLSGLIELGLNEKEAQLYLAALKMGPTTVQLLSLESGIKRATVYSCIESLIAKGLLHTEIKGVRKLFVPESPDKLTLLLERKKQTLVDIIPQLTQQYLHLAPSTNTIKIYHGVEGVKSIYDHILDDLKPKDEYLILSDEQKWYKLDPIYFENFKRKRAKLALNVKLLLQDTPHARAVIKKQKRYNQTIKILPSHVDIDTNMLITPHKMLIIQLINPIFALVIENKSLVHMNQTLFNLLWNIL